jgi:hypothetical protein
MRFYFVACGSEFADKAGKNGRKKNNKYSQNSKHSTLIGTISWESHIEAGSQTSMGNQRNI